MGVTAMRNALSRDRLRGEPITLENGHLIEAVGKNTCGDYTTDPRADHNGMATCLVHRALSIGQDARQRNARFTSRIYATGDEELPVTEGTGRAMRPNNTHSISITTARCARMTL
jgi:hypothetical protein